MRWYTVLLIGVGFVLGCGEGSRGRICDPVAQSGCTTGRCALDAEGAPACVVGGAQAGEGEACDAPEGCAPGLSCVGVQGVARCLRLCATAARPDPCERLAPQGPPSALDVAVRAGARCRVSVPDRRDIGACVLPCRPGTTDCPAGSTCGLAEPVGLLTCVPVGALGEGEACGGIEAHCAAGLVCAPLGAGRICAPLTERAAACGADRAALVLPAAQSPGSAGPTVACLPCVALGPGPDDRGPLGRCLAATPAEGIGPCGTASLECACAAFGDPAVLGPGAVEALGVRLGALGAEATWVGARRTAAGWRWADERPVPDADWAPGEPGAGDCAAIGPAGLMAQPCDRPLPSLCRAGPAA